MRASRPSAGRGWWYGGGFTLLEITIALPTLAFVSLAVVSVLVFASRTSRVVSNEIAAKNIAQSYFERMAIDDFSQVTPANYPSITLASTQPLYLDNVRGTRCEVDIAISGYGTAASGTVGTLVDSNASWTANEWAGNTLLLTDGTGRGQRSQIVSNTRNTLAVSPAFLVAPTAGTYYMINGGKTVRIATRWKYLGKNYQAKIESLIIDWGPRR